MGVRRLFSRGGQNFPGWGLKHTICLKRGGGGGGKGSLLPSPADAHPHSVFAKKPDEYFSEIDPWNVVIAFNRVFLLNSSL